MIKALLPGLLLLSACAHAPAPLPATSPATNAVEVVVRPGIETFLADVPVRLRGKRVALITNNTGSIGRARRTSI
jgi:uncharacterized protein YbbC (DUF1343 family)